MSDIIDEFFIKKAIRLSELAVEHGNEPFGALLVKDGEVVFSCENQIYTRHDPTYHAVAGLIREFCQKTGITDLREYTLYSSCEPCFMCSGAIVWAQLGRLVYAASNRELRLILGEPDVAGNEDPPDDILWDLIGVPDNGCSSLVFSNSAHKPIVHARLCQDESLSILRNFFKKRKPLNSE